jgi:hypothetical protein
VFLAHRTLYNFKHFKSFFFGALYTGTVFGTHTQLKLAAVYFREYILPYNI